MFSDFLNYVLFFTMNELSAAHLPQTHSFQPLAFELLLFSNLLYIIIYIICSFSLAVFHKTEVCKCANGLTAVP